MWLVPRSALRNLVGVEPKGSKCNPKNLECALRRKRAYQKIQGKEVIFSRDLKCWRLFLLDSSCIRNPVLDRLTGQQANGLRNESYYRATHDTTWNTTVMSAGFSPADRPADRHPPHLTSPTVNPSSGEMVYIEDTVSYPTDGSNR